MSTTLTITMQDGGNTDHAATGFMQRMRLKYKEAKQDVSERMDGRYEKIEKDTEIILNKTQGLFWRVTFLYQFVSQMYMGLYYTIPYYFKDYSEVGQYYWKVLAVYIGIQGLLNWIFTIIYDTSWTKGDTRDRPYFVRDKDVLPERYVPVLAESSSKNEAGHLNGYVKDPKNYIPWRYCERCKLDVPPRCHHCATCNVCILKKDHHCFLVGTCIGFYNQRYFAILVMYAMIVGIWSSIIMAHYISGHGYDDMVWLDFVPMFPVWWGWLVQGRYPFPTAIILNNTVMTAIIGVYGLFYFCCQMVIIASGMSLYEKYKNVPMKVSTSINENFRSVFGPCWALNFFFPAQLVFKQTDDGMNWAGLTYFKKNRQRLAI